MKKIVGCFVVFLFLASFPGSVQTQPDSSPIVICGPMDVVFVVDITGSMGGAIENVKAGLNSIILSAQTASGNDLRMGLVVFEDYVQVRLPLTDSGTDATAIMNAVLGLALGYGNNEPEASDEAIKYVATGTSLCPSGATSLGSFRSSAKKIAVLITDALPGGCNDAYEAGIDDVNAQAAANAAATAGILISSVHVNDAYNFPLEQPIMMAYATTTGGVYSEVFSTGIGTADAIDEIIAKCGISSNECPLSQGFWKTHPDNWPAETITIGGTVYTKADLLTVLASSVRGNAVLILAKQLIAAKLNIENGANPAPVGDAIDGADALLAGRDIRSAAVRTNTTVGKDMTSLAAYLDQYNNRFLTPDCEEQD